MITLTFEDSVHTWWLFWQSPRLTLPFTIVFVSETALFYLLPSIKKTWLDNLVIRPTEIHRTQWSAYARVKLEMNDVAEY
jgi:hypothetical protein